jgi:N-acyl-D-aspartate/D-glutamate deacylase
MMVETKVLMLKREQQIGKMAREYKKKYGIVDEGFVQEVSDYAVANPIFEDVAKKAAEFVPASGVSVTPGTTPSKRRRFDSSGREIQ